MYKVILINNGNEVGDIGDYDSHEEAVEAAKEFNVKFERRGGKAQVKKIKKNPVGSLLLSNDNWEDESSEEYEESEESEESEYYEESEESEESEDLKKYRTPNPSSIIKKSSQRYEFKKNTPKSSYVVPKKFEHPNERPFMFASRDITAHGVMINDDGFVLIRQPLNQYKGVRWEFYGGNIESGESISEGLNREVEEETGYKMEIVGRIMDVFISGKRMQFFLLRPLRRVSASLNETKSITWVSESEAYDLLGRNKGEYKSKLRIILERAFVIWRENNI